MYKYLENIARSTAFAAESHKVSLTNSGHLKAKDNASDALGSGERHIESAWVVQEADALVLVGAHTRQHDKVLLASLEGVHARHLDLLHTLERKLSSATEPNGTNGDVIPVHWCLRGNSAKDTKEI